MAKCPEIDVRVLWLPFTPHSRRPVLCVRCHDKENRLLQSARNLALDEDQDIARPERMSALNLDLEVCEALREFWPDDVGCGCIVKGGAEGVRAVGIASRSRERKRAAMLSIAMSLRVLRTNTHVPLNSRWYYQDVCESLRCLEEQVCILMQGHGGYSASSPGAATAALTSASSNQMRRQPLPAAAAATAASSHAVNSCTGNDVPLKGGPPQLYPWASPGAGVQHWSAASSHAAASVGATAANSSTGNNVPLKAGQHQHYPWAPPGAGIEHWGPRIPSPCGPPKERLVPPKPPPRSAKTHEKEIHMC